MQHESIFIYLASIRDGVNWKKMLCVGIGGPTVESGLPQLPFPLHLDIWVNVGRFVKMYANFCSVISPENWSV